MGLLSHGAFVVGAFVVGAFVVWDFFAWDFCRMGQFPKDNEFPQIEQTRKWNGIYVIVGTETIMG